MKIKTGITKIENGEEIIRGHKLADLVEKYSFVEAIHLLLKGNLPSENEAKMLNAMFVSAIDHGPGTASALTARIVVSAKNSLHAALAAGILAMGDRHGSAIEGAAKFFQENFEEKDIENLLKKLKEQKIRIPGYGHVILEDDLRANQLLQIAKRLGFYKKHCQLAEKVEEELNKISSKKLPLNIDGALGAIISDMDFEWPMAKMFFIIARTPGLLMQIYEEMKNDEGLRRLEEENIIYE